MFSPDWAQRPAGCSLEIGRSAQPNLVPWLCSTRIMAHQLARLAQGILVRQASFAQLDASEVPSPSLLSHTPSPSQARAHKQRTLDLLPPRAFMELRPMVALRAALVGGIAMFAKVGGAMKAAGSAKVGAAAAAMTAAATAAISGSNHEEKDTPKQGVK